LWSIVSVDGLPFDFLLGCFSSPLFFWNDLAAYLYLGKFLNYAFNQNFTQLDKEGYNESGF